MTQHELDEHLLLTTKEAIARRFASNLPVSYHDERCPTDSHFIYEYRDGRKFLVLQDEFTMNYKAISQLE